MQLPLLEPRNEEFVASGLLAERTDQVVEIVMLLREVGVTPGQGFSSMVRQTGRRFGFAANRQLMGTHSDTLFECDSAPLEHPTLPLSPPVVPATWLSDMVNKVLITR